jgi:YceI-like domain
MAIDRRILFNADATMPAARVPACSSALVRFKSGVTILLLAVTLPFAGHVSGEQRVLDTERSAITVKVFKAGLFRAFADNHIIQAPLAEGSLDDSATPHVELVVAANQMRVLDPGLSPKDRADVQARMLGPEVLDANRFAQIRFHSTSVQRLAPNRWLVRGDLELHGHIHQVAVSVTHENGHYKGSTTLRQTDFAISPISIAGGTVKVKDEITIEFDIVARDR